MTKLLYKIKKKIPDPFIQQQKIKLTRRKHFLAGVQSET